MVLDKKKLTATIDAIKAIGSRYGFNQVVCDANDYDERGLVKRWNDGTAVCAHPIQAIQMYNPAKDIDIKLTSEDDGPVVVEQYRGDGPEGIITFGSRKGFCKAARYAMILYTKKEYEKDR